MWWLSSAAGASAAAIHAPEIAWWTLALLVLITTVGLKVVAEGIETRAPLDMLREIGCEFGQGYYFARPMDGDAD